MSSGHSESRRHSLVKSFSGGHSSLDSGGQVPFFGGKAVHWEDMTIVYRVHTRVMKNDGRQKTAKRLEALNGSIYQTRKRTRGFGL